MLLQESLWIRLEAMASRDFFGIYVKGISGDYNNVVGLPVADYFMK